MTFTFVVSTITALVSLVMFLALVDQWSRRRHAFQAIWALGMLFYALGAGAEALAALAGWNDPLYRTWYLTGAMWTAAWLGLGSAFLLGRTRFGYAFALCLFLAGLLTIATFAKFPAIYGEVASQAILYFIVAGVLAVAVAVETYFQNERWPVLAGVAVVGATILSFILMVTASLPAPGWKVDPTTGAPVSDLFPPVLRLLTPFMNVTGGFALILGALFSAYVFMPKRRVLAYSLDPTQPGEQFLFNLLISPVAITVNFLASLPGAIRALLSGRIHSRVPATILIAIGGFVPTFTDSLNRFGVIDFFSLGLLIGAVFIFAGFLVSIEIFRDLRIPFTDVVLRAARTERVPGPETAGPPPGAEADHPAQA
ncbi:MAG TPA: hypothetical protein VFW92_05735 [Candidatus Limnocylindrales bacterium]|jgi:hypothetical protein|nr:hypothetical protein [Candidatus Limnocylindrales bacterium]